MKKDYVLLKCAMEICMYTTLFEYNLFVYFLFVYYLLQGKIKDTRQKYFPAAEILRII